MNLNQIQTSDVLPDSTSAVIIDVHLESARVVSNISVNDVLTLKGLVNLKHTWHITPFLKSG